ASDVERLRSTAYPCKALADQPAPKSLNIFKGTASDGTLSRINAHAPRNACAKLHFVEPRFRASRAGPNHRGGNARAPRSLSHFADRRSRRQGRSAIARTTQERHGDGDRGGDASYR